MRLDLGRNQEFLDELAFMHLANSFITYCADILSVAALGSPEKFNLSVRIEAANFAKAKSAELMRELGIAVVSRILFMGYFDLRRLILSNVHLKPADLRRFAFIDRAVEKRNRLTHGLGIANLADHLHKDGRWGNCEKVGRSDVNRLWGAVASVSHAVDIALMKEFDVWRGVEICAPGLYRRKGGEI